MLFLSRFLFSYLKYAVLVKFASHIINGACYYNILRDAISCLFGYGNILNDAACHVGYENILNDAILSLTLRLYTK